MCYCKGAWDAQCVGISSLPCIQYRRGYLDIPLSRVVCVYLCVCGWVRAWGVSGQICLFANTGLMVASHSSQVINFVMSTPGAAFVRPALPSLSINTHAQERRVFMCVI
jgi:hypothetical protein